MRLFLALILFVPCLSFAKGKFIFQPNYYTQNKQVAPMGGISVFEKIPVIPFGVNLFAGVGDNYMLNDEMVSWTSLRGSVDFLGDGYQLSPGVQFVSDSVSKQYQTRYFVRFSVDMWE